MGREFTNEAAQQLCASSSLALDQVSNVIQAQQDDLNRLKGEAQKVFSNHAISSQILTSLQTRDPNVSFQSDEIALLRTLYVYVQRSEVSSSLNAFWTNRVNIQLDIRLIKSTSSSLKWFFTGKQQRAKANETFWQLSQFMEENSEMINKAVERCQSLDRIKAHDAREAISGNEQTWMRHLANAIPDIFHRENLSPSITQKTSHVKDIVRIYQAAQEKQKALEKQYKASADKEIDSLIMEQTLRELRNQSIDAVAQKRSGIRVKALKDHGYQNMADLYSATIYQLASVHGISQEAAKTIKEASKEIAFEVSRTVKLKISSDERTPAATSLLKAVRNYERIKKADQGVTPDIRQRFSDVHWHENRLSNLLNNLQWTLAGHSQREKYIESYQYLDKEFNQSIIQPIQSFFQVVTTVEPISDEMIWADFGQRSIEYFNLLEELRPGLFGNDDLLYGLPEDLAQKIQDQVYFPQGLKVSLRRYQEWGVKYILHQGRVLLGDEMGLGKTVQAIAVMVSLRNTGAKKFLVVCPASVLPNWCKEIDRKSEFRSIKIHGPGRQEAFDYWNQNGGVAVTTYETLNTLVISNSFKYDLLIVDEAHFVKNENAQRSQNVRRFGTYTKRLLYMTGTALENKVEEMLSLLLVLNPRVASQAQRIAFMSTAPQFRQMIAPVYYRRKREEVLTELPAITFSREWCDLLPEEYAVYRKAVLAKDRTSIRRVSWNMDRPEKSAKIRRLIEIINEAESDGRKILVFSFYLETIQQIIRVLGNRCTQPINGSVPVQRRQEIIDEFEQMPAGSVLPAQIQAGGTGLNIQSASVVIICEPQLKPSIENQAISRAYRMGQTRKVLVYRLLASNTIEERIDDMLTEKQAIFDAFADISEAVTDREKAEYQIDNTTFGRLIQEEIDRINATEGNEPTPHVRQLNANPYSHAESVKIPKMEEKNKTGSSLLPIFSSVEDFMQYASSQGLRVKDNREKGGCLWIEDDPRINPMIESLIFNDRRFKLTEKSKALGGKPGWYY